MNVINRRLPLVIFTIVLLLPGIFQVSDVYSQSSNQNQNQLKNIFEDQGDGLSEFYFVDELGLQLASQTSPLEVTVDPSTYKLGPYDLLSVESRGSVSIRLRGISVNAQGDIILPTIGKISIRGLTIVKAEQKIESAYQEKYQDINVEISLDSPRPQIIHFTGDIPNPGKYIVPYGTRVNSLLERAFLPAKEMNKNVSDQAKNFSQSRFSSNQSIRSLNVQTYYNSNDNSTGNRSFPDTLNLKKDKYNLRNISVKRNDSTIINVDLISYLRGGAVTSNPILENGDVVTIKKKKPSTPRISISGAVSSAVEMAYSPHDNIRNLINIAGGYTSNADTSQALIYHADGSKKQIDLAQRDTKYPLGPNDRVIIPYLEKQAVETSSAWIKGSVKYPGNYPIKKDTTNVLDILQMAGGLRNDALKHGAYLMRNENSDRYVQSPTDFDPTKLIRASNQLLQGFDYMELEEALGHNRVPINLNKPSEQLEDLKLTDGDVLYIPKNTHSIVIFGQVNEPGYYAYNESLSANDYIRKASGFTVAADEDEVYIIKAGSRSWYRPGETKLQSGDIIFINRTPYQDVVARQNYKQDRTQLILSAISTITAIITTTVAITR